MRRIHQDGERHRLGIGIAWVLLDAVDDDPARHVDLRRGEPGAVVVVHRLEHVVDQALDLGRRMASGDTGSAIWRSTGWPRRATFRMAMRPRVADRSGTRNPKAALTRRGDREPCGRRRVPAPVADALVVAAWIALAVDTLRAVRARRPRARTPRRLRTPGAWRCSAASLAGAGVCSSAGRRTLGFDPAASRALGVVLAGPASLLHLARPARAGRGWSSAVGGAAGTRW